MLMLETLVFPQLQYWTPSVTWTWRALPVDWRQVSHFLLKSSPEIIIGPQLPAEVPQSALPSTF